MNAATTIQNLADRLKDIVTSAQPETWGVWVPACGGTEQPFKTRNGQRLLYMWNKTNGDHRYYDLDKGVFLDDSWETMAAYGLV